MESIPSMSGVFVQIRSWNSLANGYDDWTMKQFAKETGIQVLAKTPAERHTFLTGEKRKEWLGWRAKKMTEFYNEFRAFLDEYNPKLKIYVEHPLTQEYTDDTGVDMSEIIKIHDVYPAKSNPVYKRTPRHSARG